MLIWLCPYQLVFDKHHDQDLLPASIQPYNENIINVTKANYWFKIGQPLGVPKLYRISPVKKKLVEMKLFTNEIW